MARQGSCRLDCGLCLHAGRISQQATHQASWWPPISWLLLACFYYLLSGYSARSPVCMFSASRFSDNFSFQQALAAQPNLVPHPDYPTAHIVLAFVLFFTGQLLVITSMFALGVTGTYLGDYFGILMSHRVTTFPFNVVEDPMYIGSTLCFLGTSLWFRSPAGLAISLFVFIVYQVALSFEG